MLGVLFIVAVLVMPVAALVATRRLRAEAKALSDRLDRVEADLASAQAALAGASGPPLPAPPDETAQPEPQATPDVPPTAARMPAAETSPGPWQTASPADTPTDTPAAAPVEPRRSLEERIAAQWMIWLGAVTVGLSAVFLFRYAIDQGWMTPMARVVAGLGLGGLLLSAGEWSARRPAVPLGRAVSPDNVPPALTAAGIFAIYASVFAAHGLYGLLGPATAFVALGLVSYAALGLALRQGWFVALMGLAGGYLMPALIDSPQAQALPLFLYLLMLSAGCLAVMVWRHWWWFAALTLLGALFWPVAWLASNWSMADQGVLGGYGLGLAALFGALSSRLPLKQPQTPTWRWMSAILANTSGLGFALSGLLLILLANAAGYNGAAFVFLVVYAGLALTLTAWRPALEGLVVIAALLVLLTFVT